MIGDLLLEPVDIQTHGNSAEADVEKVPFVNFISQLEGWKTRCKNLHWSAVKKNIHVYLDEFLEVLSDYQDSLAEEIMGLYGPLKALDINGTVSTSKTAKEFIEEVIQGTHSFYRNISDKTCTAGIKSECETFMHSCHKYKYLFSLSAWDMSY